LASEAKVPTTAEHGEAKLNVLEVKEGVTRMMYKLLLPQKRKNKTKKNMLKGNWGVDHGLM
jgi:hypothetical protein